MVVLVFIAWLFGTFDPPGLSVIGPDALWAAEAVFGSLALALAVTAWALTGIVTRPGKPYEVAEPHDLAQRPTRQLVDLVPAEE